MSLRAEIERALSSEPMGDAETLAATVVGKVAKAELVPLVAQVIRDAQRSSARTQERQAFREAFQAKANQPRPVLPDGLRSLFATPFRLGDGTEVRWLKATVGEHRQRIELLTKLRGGIDRTIAQHQDAVALIEDAGVTCLDDLDHPAQAAA